MRTMRVTKVMSSDDELVIRVVCEQTIFRNVGLMSNLKLTPINLIYE